MWLAHLEKVPAKLAAWLRTAARLRAKDLAKVLGGVVVTLLCLEVTYVVLGNLVLRSRLIKDAIAVSAGFHLEYGTAYTLLPGRVQVEGLRLRVETYDVQFLIGIDRAELDISLSELAFKKFHVVRLAADGVQFRMRHKLLVVGDDAARVRAYPPIAGFADPPYYVGLRPPPLADIDYDLWQVRVENVVAELSELWVLEHRFRGRGEARGSFVVRPARWVQVEPASLVLRSGTLTMGDELVARQVRGRVQFSIPGMDVRTTEGLAVLRKISSSVKLELQGGSLTFLDAYLARLGSARYAGSGDWSLEANLQRGVIQRGSRAHLNAKAFEICHADGVLGGDLLLTLARDAQIAEGQLLLDVTASTLLARRALERVPGPRLRGLRAQLRINGVDLSGDLSTGSAAVSIEHASVPALAWFDTTGTRLSGSAEGDFELVREADHRVLGSARLRARQAALTSSAFGARGDLASQLAFTLGTSVAAPLQMKELSAQLTSVTLRAGERKSEPFGALIDGAGLRIVLTGKPEMRGTLRVHVTSAEALLPLVLSRALRDLISTALDLQALDGRAAIALTGQGVEVKIVNATSGNLRMQGHFDNLRRAPRAVLLFTSGPINMGVTISDGSSKIAPFVGDDWLSFRAQDSRAALH